MNCLGRNNFALTNSYWLTWNIEKNSKKEQALFPIWSGSNADSTWGQERDSNSPCSTMALPNVKFNWKLTNVYEWNQLIAWYCLPINFHWSKTKWLTGAGLTFDNKHITAVLVKIHKFITLKCTNSYLQRTIIKTADLRKILHLQNLVLCAICSQFSDCTQSSNSIPWYFETAFIRGRKDF